MRPLSVLLVLAFLASAGHPPPPGSPRAQGAIAAPESRAWSCLTSSVAATQGFQSAGLDPGCTASSQPAVHFAPAVVLRVAEPITMPRAPAGLAAAVAGRSLTLTWQGAEAATSFLLEAGTQSGRSDLVRADVRSSAPALTISSVPAGIYFFRVRARNASGTSAASNEIVVTIPADCLGT